MSCQRCTQMLTRHHDEMKCVSCGFTVELPETRIKPLAIPNILPYVGKIEAMKGRQALYQYLPNMKDEKAPFLSCPYCGELNLIRGTNTRHVKIGAMACATRHAACSNEHHIIVLEDMQGTLIGWR